MQRKPRVLNELLESHRILSDHKQKLLQWPTINKNFLNQTFQGKPIINHINVYAYSLKHMNC